MNKFKLLIAVLFFSAHAGAQSVVQMRTGKAELTMKRPIVNNDRAAASKTTAILTSWFHFNVACHEAGSGTTGAFIGVYPDSNIFLTSATTAPFYVWAHGIGTSFDPTSQYYSSAWSNSTEVPPLFIINAGASYTIDSINIAGLYQRVNTAYPNDTLYIEVTLADTTGAWQITQASYNLVTMGIIPIPPSPWDTTWTLSNAYYNWNTNAIDGANTLPVWRFTKILDSAAAIDTGADGMNNWSFPTTASPAVNISGGATWPMAVPAGKKVVAYAHFASGHTYPLGTPDTACNMWKHYSEDFGVTPLSTFAVDGDQSGGLISSTDDRYHIGGYSRENITGVGIVPVLSRTYYYATPAQVHNPWFGFHIRAFVPVGEINQVLLNNGAMAIPNPATNQLTISYEKAPNTPGIVTLTNMVGQMVATQKAGERETLFNTSALPAGIYIYTLSVNGERFTGRVTVTH